MRIRSDSALGARPVDVMGSVLSEAAVLWGTGVMLGFVLSAGVARMLSRLLFGVGELDLVTYVASSGVLAVSAVAACYVPARRAARVDPMVALRYE